MKIEKSKLLKFIQKYNLSGTNESVKFVINAEESTLTAEFYSSDKSLLGKTILSGFKHDEDCVIGVHDASKLVKMLNISSVNQVDLTFLKSSDGRIVKIIIDDGEGAKYDYATADLTAIPTIPARRKMPPCTVELNILKSFATKFKNATKALENVDVFTLVPDKSKDQISLVLGYATNINIDQSAFIMPFESGKGDLSKNISFSAKHLANIIDANLDVFVKDDSKIVFGIAEQGISNVSIESGDFKSEYLIVESKQKN